MKSAARSTASHPSVPLDPVLYGRAPKGLGTPLVESLSGYLARLCEARSLAVTDVLDLLVRPLVPPGLLRPRRDLLWFLSQHVVGVDGFGAQAVWFVTALAQLTRQPCLTCHTCLAWRDIFAPASPGVLARCGKRWCSRCLEQWHRQGVEPWEPLLWRLSPVTRCPIHRVRLSERCPGCGHPQKVVTQYVPFPHCDRCGQLLFVGDPLRDSGGFDERFDRAPLWEWWTSVAVAQMLSVHRHPERAASPAGIRSLLELRIRHRGIGSEPLARYLRVARTAMIAWRDGKRKPRLRSFVQVCMLLGEHPAAVAYPDVPDGAWQSWSPWPGVQHPWSAPVSTSFDTVRRRALDARWARVAAELDAVIATGDCPSPSALASSVGERYAGLSRRFPDRIEKLRSRRAADRALLRRRYGQALDEAIADPDPLSLNMLSKALGVDSAVLQRAHPERCARLVKRHAAWAARQRRERTAHRCAMVRDAVHTLVAAGERPTLHGAVVHAGLPPTVCGNPAVRLAWLEALRALGVSPGTTRRICRVPRSSRRRTRRRIRA